MSQSRKFSFYESFMNVAVGILVAFVSNAFVFPAFGYDLSTTQNIQITAIYTAISIIRSYCIRRWFNGFKEED